jgi:hypothetical protein
MMILPEHYPEGPVLCRKLDLSFLRLTAVLCSQPTCDEAKRAESSRKYSSEADQDKF